MFHSRFVSTCMLSTLLLVSAASPIHADDAVGYCAYEFTVCPKQGGSDEGVDFRSHFAVYAAFHNLSGWVRNNCDKCVYGMFASFTNCQDAHELAEILQTPSRIVVELDQNAQNLEANLTEIAGYPNAMCGGKRLPERYVAKNYAVVDWTFSNNGCNTPCDCLPTSPIVDCSETDPLPDGATWTGPCQRYPLGADTHHFPDCNSIYTFQDSVSQDSVSCFKIDNGTIVSSGLCTNRDGTEFGWVNDTHAAQCCGPYDSKLGRKGYLPPLAGCSVYGKDNPYDQKCEPKNSTGTTSKAEL